MRIASVSSGASDGRIGRIFTGIPAVPGKLMSNVAVTVHHDSGPSGLLGLHQGAPLTRWSTFYAGALPDRITIYRRAICAVCNSDSKVVEQRSIAPVIAAVPTVTHASAMRAPASPQCPTFHPARRRGLPPCWHCATRPAVRWVFDKPCSYPGGPSNCSIGGSRPPETRYWREGTSLVQVFDATL